MKGELNLDCRRLLPGIADPQSRTDKWMITLLLYSGKVVKANDRQWPKAAEQNEGRNER